MKEDFLYLLPSMILSYVIFYKLIKDLNLFTWINKKTNRCVITLATIFTLFFISISILDIFTLSKGVHNLYLGVFLGTMLSIVNNIKYPKSNYTRKKSKK